MIPEGYIIVWQTKEGKLVEQPDGSKIAVPNSSGNGLFFLSYESARKLADNKNFQYPDLVHHPVKHTLISLIAAVNEGHLKGSIEDITEIYGEEIVKKALEVWYNRIQEIQDKTRG